MKGLPDAKHRTVGRPLDNWAATSAKTHMAAMLRDGYAKDEADARQQVGLPVKG